MTGKTIRICLAAMVLSMVTAWAGSEEEIAPENLPEVVKETLALFEGATVVEAEVEKEDGKVTYEVEIVLDGQRIELEFNEKGKITEVEFKGKGHHDDDDDDDD